eukprot:scaffold65592_cov22-Tisochrysis_lutea.AAC.3
MPANLQLELADGGGAIFHKLPDKTRTAHQEGLMHNLAYADAQSSKCRCTFKHMLMHTQAYADAHSSIC